MGRAVAEPGLEILVMAGTLGRILPIAWCQGFQALKII
jgi:hypothetical protein